MTLHPFLCKARQFAAALFAVTLLALPMQANAEDSLCARVKIEIKQELALERQGFDAEMKINNGLDTMAIDNVSISLSFVDDAGVAVKATSDPNDTTAQFFVNVTSLDNVIGSDIHGGGSVAPATTGDIHWLIIPAPGTGGTSPSGKMYLVGATLNYTLAGEAKSVTVVPDSIYVKPMPLLTLDYFLTKEVIADDPLTPAVEPPEPFTLGVRVRNSGAADAHNLTIDSAQPKIVDNQQGLLINFLLNGSYLDDQSVNNTLLLNFGDVLAGKARVGRWIMQTSLAGQFVDFTAEFSHSDDLGGTLTSLIQAVNTHFLVHDVKVDLAGRDSVRDFLALDGDTYRVYESDLVDTVVNDVSAASTLNSSTNAQGQAVYRLTTPVLAGFVYAKLADPYTGTRTLAQIVRSDGKYMLSDNVWLSKSKNSNGQYDYWINFFDANTTGSYDVAYGGAPSTAEPPVIQPINDQVVKEGQNVSFLVDASSPAQKQVTLSAAPLPTGATFEQQSASTTMTESRFNWTPAKGQAGTYFIAYTATDGTLSSTRSATISVVADTPPPGPAIPVLVSPATGGDVTESRPALIVQTGTDPQDPTQSVLFELYADEAMQQLIETQTVAKGTTTGAAGTTSYTPAADLPDNTRYWWRARASGKASDGTVMNSEWLNSDFRVNLYNDPPDNFNLISPLAGSEVASLTPELVLANTSDKDGDPITYAFDLYSDAGLTTRIGGAGALPPGTDGTTRWTVDVPLVNHSTYYWRASAKDSWGATTDSLSRSFVVNTGNTAPTLPVLQLPADGATIVDSTTDLVAANSSDAESDPLTYVFELDTDSSFSSANHQLSAALPAGTDGTTRWTASGLMENQHYFWRVNVSDGRATTQSAVATFFKNAINEAPPVPVVSNPGDGSWVATQQPVFDVNPVLDPEGEAVTYRFEVYSDAALGTQVATGTATTGTSWTPAAALTDKTTYYWRVRAEDVHGLASNWSPVAVLYVSTGAYVAPTVVMTAPASITTPVVNGSSKTVTLAWTGTDSNINASVGLYYDLNSSAYAGTKLADGFTQPAGSTDGQFQWDVTALPAGAYYFYAVISDPMGSGHGYAPGALVVPANPQLGSVTLTVPQALTTSSSGGASSFTVQLANAPTAEVTFPVSSSNTALGVVSPNTLTFTPTNWSAPQTVTVTGVTGTTGRGTATYQVDIGNAVSLDPNYIGINGGSVPVTHSFGLLGGGGGGRNNIGNNSLISVYDYQIVSQKSVGTSQTEYVLRARLLNTGPSVGSAQLSLQQVPSAYVAIDSSLSFGAVGTQQSGPSKDTFTVRVPAMTPRKALESGAGLQWTAVTH